MYRLLISLRRRKHMSMHAPKPIIYSNIAGLTAKPVKAPGSWPYVLHQFLWGRIRQKL